MYRLLLLTLICFSTNFSSAHAQLIKWVDANGKVHYSDSRPSSAQQSTTLDIETALVESSKAGEDLEQISPIAEGSESVDLYTTSWCPYCAKARAYLDSKNIPYTDYDIEKDSNAAQRKRELDPSYSGIPLALIKGKLVRGFSESQYQRALDKY